MMKKYFYKFAVFCLLAGFCVPLIVNAVTIENPLGAQSTFWDIFGKIIDFLFKLSLPIAVLMIITAAFFFLTSAGDPEKVRRARRLIVWTLVGVVIIFLSKAIVNMLLEAIGSDAKIK